MHIKVLRHSRGSGRGAVGYLLSARDHRGETRAEIKVLRGDPALVGRLIDALATVHRYSSAVISWAPGDDPDRC